MTKHLKRVTGDLLQLATDGKFDVIVHGCNCFNVMASGIAGQIAKLFPEVVVSDNLTVKGANKVGTYNFTTVERNGRIFIICNAYTQYNFSRGEDVFEYDGFKNILRQLGSIDALKGKRFGFPLIGCGLAGGDKNRVIELLEEFAIGNNATLVEWDG